MGSDACGKRRGALIYVGRGGGSDMCEERRGF